MRVFRATCAVVLSVAFACFNVRALDLHVHEADDHDREQHHAPAVHHHDTPVALPSDDLHVTAVDADDTVVAVRLSVASPSSLKPAAVTEGRAIAAAPITASIVGRTTVIARAHGPPSSAPPSLRAPPLRLPA